MGMKISNKFTIIYFCLLFERQRIRFLLFYSFVYYIIRHARVDLLLAHSCGAQMTKKDSKFDLFLIQYSDGIFVFAFIIPLRESFSIQTLHYKIPVLFKTKTLFYINKSQRKSLRDQSIFRICFLYCEPNFLS